MLYNPCKVSGAKKSFFKSQLKKLWTLAYEMTDTNWFINCQFKRDLHRLAVPSTPEIKCLSRYFPEISLLTLSHWRWMTSPGCPNRINSSLKSLQNESSGTLIFENKDALWIVDSLWFWMREGDAVTLGTWFSGFRTLMFTDKYIWFLCHSDVCGSTAQYYLG